MDLIIIMKIMKNATLRKILQHKRHLKVSHWDPSKLTHFNRYFDEDRSLSSSKYLLNCVNLLGSQFSVTRFKVSLKLQNFFQCIRASTINDSAKKIVCWQTIVPLKPLDIIVMWYSRGFRGDPNWSKMIPRYDNLWEGCTPDNFLEYISTYI